MKIKSIVILLLVCCNVLIAQDKTGKDIIILSDTKSKTINSKMKISMTIVRPKWSKKIEFVSWSKGKRKAMLVISSPKRDRGVSYLLRDKELWNWQPVIGEIIKMPPSMIIESWMGSDLTNGDVVNYESAINDYDHKLLGEEEFGGQLCYKIEMIPKKNSLIVWDKVVSWISKKDYLLLQTQLYDEDGDLVASIVGKEIKDVGALKLPTKIEFISHKKEGVKTILEYIDIEFDIELEDDFFSIKNLKRLEKYAY